MLGTDRDRRGPQVQLWPLRGRLEDGKKRCADLLGRRCPPSGEKLRSESAATITKFSCRGILRKLFMFSVTTAARARREQYRLGRGRRVSCRRDRCCSNQHGMTDQACRKHRIASKGHRKGNCPHPPQHLQNHVPRGYIGNVPKRTDLMIENEIPRVRYQLSHLDHSIKTRRRLSAPISIIPYRSINEHRS